MVEFIISSILPWLITIFFVLMIVFLFYKIPAIAKYVTKNLRVFLLLIFVVLIGAYLRFASSPDIHRVYYDEDRYLSYAVAFARFNQVRNIEFATLDKVIIGKPDQVARVTVPLINGWMLKLFGYSENVLFKGAKLFSTLQIILIFICALLFFRQSSIALIASLLLALFPSAIFWSTSTVLDPYFVTFSLISFIGAVLYARQPSRINAFFLLMSIFILLFVRLESVLFLAVLGLSILAIRSHEKIPLITKKDAFFISALLLLIVGRGVLSVSVIGQTWCCGESTPLETFRPTYFIRHILLNLRDLFMRPEVPWSISATSLAVILGVKDLRVRALGGWLLLYFTLYSSYYAGRFFDYQFSGSYGRFFLMLMTPLIMLTSYGILIFLNWLRVQQLNDRIKYSIIAIILTAISLYPTIRNYTTLIRTSPYEKLTESRSIEFHNYLEQKFINKIPKNAVVIHSLTGYTLLKGHPSIYIGSIYDNTEVGEYLVKSLKKGVPIYSVGEYLCDVSPQKCRHFTPFLTFNPVNIPDASKNIELQYMKLELKK